MTVMRLFRPTNLSPFWYETALLGIREVWVEAYRPCQPTRKLGVTWVGDSVQEIWRKPRVFRLFFDGVHANIQSGTWCRKASLVLDWQGSVIVTGAKPLFR